MKLNTMYLEGGSADADMSIGHRTGSPFKVNSSSLSTVNWHHVNGWMLYGETYIVQDGPE